jgi:hypothetical protein
MINKKFLTLKRKESDYIFNVKKEKEKKKVNQNKLYLIFI